MTTRICTKCLKEFPATLEYFYAHPRGKFGLNNVCKPCQKEKARQSELNRKGTESYKAKAAAKARRMYAKHREKCNERSRSWRQRNPQAAKKYRRIRRQRLGSGTYTAAQWEQKVQAHGGNCYWCKEPATDGLVVDHLIPLSRGGQNVIENVVPSCKPCNQSKHMATPEEFLARRPDLQPLHL